jgi:hypothetical protein
MRYMTSADAALTCKAAVVCSCDTLSSCTTSDALHGSASAASV